MGTPVVHGQNTESLLVIYERDTDKGGGCNGFGKDLTVCGERGNDFVDIVHKKRPLLFDGFYERSLGFGIFQVEPGLLQYLQLLFGLPVACHIFQGAGIISYQHDHSPVKVQALLHDGYDPVNQAIHFQDGRRFRGNFLDYGHVVVALIGGVEEVFG